MGEKVWSAALERSRPIPFLHCMTSRALPDHVESRDRKGIARIQGVGACPCRKSRATFSGHALVLPLRVASTLKLDDDAPSVQSHYRTFNPIAGVSVPVPRIDTPTLMAAGHLGFSLGNGTTGSRVPHQSRSHAHAAFMPDAGWAISRRLPTLARGMEVQILVSTSLFTLRHVIGGSLTFVFMRHS